MSCRSGGRTVMLPVTSPRPKYWTSTFPSFRSACFVLPVHRSAGVDDVAQRGVVVPVDSGMLRQPLHDGRDREHVRHAPSLDEAPGLLDVEAVAGQKHGLGATRDLRELMDAGPVREWRHHERGVAMRGAGGEEEPARIVVLDIRDRRGLAIVDAEKGVVILAERGGADRQDEAEAG